MNLVVVKFGGSLVRTPAFPAVVSAVWNRFPQERIVNVVGGGEAADIVRAWQPRFSLSDSAAHWLAVDSLRLTHALMRCLFPRLVPVAAPVDLPENAPALLDAGEFMHRAGRDLPESWSVTSDTIAARCAVQFGAARLVLVKSAAVATMSRREAAARGLVDPCFPEAARGVPQVWALDMREPGAPPACWHE